MIDQEMERCTIEDLGLSITGTDAPILIEILNDYLATFAKPACRDRGSQFTGRWLCLNCGSVLDGFLGSFQWGIAHGEGLCGKCTWPARAYHRPKDADGQHVTEQFTFILQYHPSLVTSEARHGNIA